MGGRRGVSLNREKFTTKALRAQRTTAVFNLNGYFDWYVELIKIQGTTPDGVAYL